MDEHSATRRDWGRLAILVLVAAVVRCWLLAHTEVPARDCIDFVRCAVRFDDRPWADVLRSTHQAPGYPLLILGVAKAARGCGFDLDAGGYAQIARLISAVAGLLTIVPMYFTGKSLFGANAGFLAALLFQALPVCVRVTCDGLSEGVFFLFTTIALWIAVGAIQCPTWWRFVMCGLVTGLAYLTRPEGLEIAIVTLLASVIAGRRAGSRRVPVKAVVGLACGLAPLISAYVAVTGRISNKPTSVQMFQSEPRPVIVGAAGPPLAVFWSEETGAGQSRAFWAARAVLQESSKATNYVGLVLAVAAVSRFRARLRADVGLWLLLLLPVLHGLLLWRMAATVGYVSERHALMVALVACWWTGGLLAAIAKRFRFGTVVLALAILAVGMPSTLKPLHANRTGHRAAGEWLSANVNRYDEIIDPFAWAHFYAGFVFHEGKVAPAAPEERVRYVVVEESANPHERLATMTFARQIAARGVCVYRTPVSRREGKAVVAIYRVMPSP